MTQEIYLLDTHALIYWSSGENVSEEFIQFFDTQAKSGNVLVSSVSFWETALLAKKGKIEIENIQGWKHDLLNNTGIKVVNPTADDMIESTLLPPFHSDPVDRLLVVQANRSQALLITMDVLIKKYSVPIFWL